MSIQRDVSAIVIGLHRILQEIDQQTSDIARSHDLTLPQFAVLEALLHKGPRTVGELKSDVLSSAGTIPVIVGNLERDGLVQRSKDPHDLRRSIVSLTDLGRERIEATCPENDAMLNKYLSVWSAEERQQLISLIKIWRKENKQF